MHQYLKCMICLLMLDSNKLDSLAEAAAEMQSPHNRSKFFNYSTSRVIHLSFLFPNTQKNGGFLLFFADMKQGVEERG